MSDNTDNLPDLEVSRSLLSKLRDLRHKVESNIENFAELQQQFEANSQNEFGEKAIGLFSSENTVMDGLNALIDDVEIAINKLVNEEDA